MSFIVVKKYNLIEARCLLEPRGNFFGEPFRKVGFGDIGKSQDNVVCYPDRVEFSLQLVQVAEDFLPECPSTAIVD